MKSENPPPSSKTQTTDVDSSTSNPQGAGRRRLLQLTGGIGASAIVSSEWKKPVIETVLIPAHAQTTDSESDSDSTQNSTPAGPCVLTISAAATLSISSGTITDDAVLNAGILGGSTATLTLLDDVVSTILSVNLTTTLPPGSYTAAFAIGFGQPIDQTLQGTVQCCNNFATTQAPTSAVCVADSLAFTLLADGTCLF